MRGSTLNAAPAVQRELRIAARALARHGLAHAYGHCSVRLDAGNFLVCASRPMGLIGPGEPGTVVPVTGALPAGVLGEVRLHQQIYQRHAHVRAVTRTMPPLLMALGTARRTPRTRHGMGAYFGTGAALWDDPQLVRDDERAAAVIDAMGNANAIVMRGNGVLVIGRHAVVDHDVLVRAVGVAGCCVRGAEHSRRQDQKRRAREPSEGSLEIQHARLRG